MEHFSRLSGGTITEKVSIRMLTNIAQMYELCDNCIYMRQAALAAVVLDSFFVIAYSVAIFSVP